MGREQRSGGGNRIEVRQNATLINSDGLAVPVSLKNFSRGGFSIEHAGEDLIVGELVTIQSERGTQAKGEIKWIGEKEAGGVFIDLPAGPEALT